MEEITTTPIEQVLEIFRNKDENRPKLLQLMLVDGHVVSTTGTAICWTDHELCNGIYPVPHESLQKAMRSVLTSVAVKRVDRDVTIEDIKNMIGGDVDFRHTRRDCDQCGASGTCNECDCGTNHACGKCDGVGSFEVPPKKLIGIGTGVFTTATLNMVYYALQKLEMDRFHYIGSDSQNYIHHFRLGEDCWLNLASEKMSDGQEVVPIDLS